MAGKRRGRLPYRQWAEQARCAEWGVPYGRVSRARAFKDAGWICALCGGPVDKRLRFPHPGSRSIDHIIPLSVPGSPGHVQSNVQLAHLGCNSSKGGRNRLPAITGVP